jgi:PPM family protein phosphatase
MPLILRTAVLTDVGLRRGNNEDCAYAGRRLLAIADGMGGLPAGELASDLAITALAELDADAGPDAAAGPVAGTGPDAQPDAGTGPDAAAGSDGDAGPDAEAVGGEPTESDPAEGEPDSDGGHDGLLRALRSAFDAATARIRAAAAQDDANRYGMGTTVTAVLFDGDDFGRAALMHVGDSRGYLFRDGVLTQLTKDDTYVQALVDQGVITPDGARRHPQRSLVTQAMQGQPIAPYATSLEPREGDVLLLCSDGLSDVVTDDQIARLMGDRTGLDECARSLVDAALEEGGPDNVTVVLAELLR